MTKTSSRAGGRPGRAGAAAWLSLAATPTCAAMALWTGLADGGRTDLLCTTGPSASPLTGMTTMYLLMAAFHAPTWLRRPGRNGPKGEPLDA